MSSICLLMSSVHLKRTDTWFQRLEKTKSMGMRGIELFSAGYANGDLTESSLVKKIRNKAEKLNLEITAHPWFNFNNYTIEETEESLEQIFDVCSGLGINKINLHFNFFASRESGIMRPVKIIRSLLDCLEERDLQLLFENVPNNISNPLGSTPEEFGEFFEHLDSHPRLGFTLDVGHACISGNMESFISEFKEKWGYTHITDTKGETDDHLGAGMGIIDWHHFAALAFQVGYNGPFVIEFSEDYLSKCSSYLKASFEENGWNWPQLNI